MPNDNFVPAVTDEAAEESAEPMQCESSPINEDLVPRLAAQAVAEFKHLRERFPGIPMESLADPVQRANLPLAATGLAVQLSLPTAEELQKDLKEGSEVFSGFVEFVDKWKEGKCPLKALDDILTKASKFVDVAAKVAAGLSIGCVVLGAAAGVLKLFMGVKTDSEVILEKLDTINSRLIDMRVQLQEQFDHLKDFIELQENLSKLETYLNTIQSFEKEVQQYYKSLAANDQDRIAEAETYLKQHIQLGELFIAVNGIAELVLENKPLAKSLPQAICDYSMGDLRAVTYYTHTILLHTTNALSLEGVMARILMPDPPADTADADAWRDKKLYQNAQITAELYAPLIAGMSDTFKKVRDTVLSNMGANVKKKLETKVLADANWDFRDHQRTADHIVEVLAEQWFWVAWMVGVSDPISPKKANDHMLKLGTAGWTKLWTEFPCGAHGTKLNILVSCHEGLAPPFSDTIQKCITDWAGLLDRQFWQNRWAKNKYNLDVKVHFVADHLITKHISPTFDAQREAFKNIACLWVCRTDRHVAVTGSDESRVSVATGVSSPYDRKIATKWGYYDRGYRFVVACFPAVAIRPYGS